MYRRAGRRWERTSDDEERSRDEALPTARAKQRLALSLLLPLLGHQKGLSGDVSGCHEHRQERALRRVCDGVKEPTDLADLMGFSSYR